ncbi:hypothetical protein BC826DRAFT_983911 [Russula brevipes]|nr:hypothetical protein BC826DRAFT_983911 [Russula brevipes]
MPRNRNRDRPTNPSSYPPGGSSLYGPPSPVPPIRAPQQGLSSVSGGQVQLSPQTFTISTGHDVTPTASDQDQPLRYQLNGMVTGVLVPTESSSGMTTGAQPANADFVLASGPGADGYGPHSLRGAPGGRPEPALSSRSRSRDPSPNPGPQTHTLSPVPGPVPSHGNWLRDPTANPGPPLPAGRYASSRDPSPRPGPGIYGPRSQTPSPIPGAAYGNQSRDLPSVPVPVPGTNPARGRYPDSRSPSPLPPRAGAPPSPGAFPTSSSWRNRSRDPSPIPPVAPGRYANSRAPPEAGAPGLSRTVLPDAFSRPANIMQPNTSFETRKIQDMDDFYVPMMPKVLVPRNVSHDEWIRFVQDITLAWAGRLSSQSSVVATAESIDVWNNSFFTPRGVEVILFEGRERRSGQMIGQTERDLPGFGEDSDSDSLSSDSEYGRGAVVGGSYADSRRMRAESKAEKRRKKKEKARRTAAPSARRRSRST